MRIRKGKNVMWVRDEWEVDVRSRVIYRGSYMSVHGLLFLSNELGKRSLFRDEFNKFNNTGTRMLDSTYHMALKYLKIAFLVSFPYFTQRYNARVVNLGTTTKLC